MSEARLAALARMPALVHERQCLAQAEGESALTLHSMRDHLGVAIGLTVASCGLYLVACAIGSTWYTARKWSIERRLMGAFLEAGSTDQQIRAIFFAEAGNEPFMHRYGHALKTLQRLEARMLAGEMLEVTARDIQGFAQCGIRIDANLGPEQVPRACALVWRKIESVLSSQS